MKNFLSNKIVSIILLVAVVVSLIFYVNMLAQPISYGRPYRHASVYDGDDFDSEMVFYPDWTMVVRNTNFDEDMKFYYYYMDGYLFFTMAQTEEEYEEEVTRINANFEEAVSSPFYAAKMNAFKMTDEGLDDYISYYFCQDSIFVAMTWGVGELILIGFAVISVLRCKKTKCEE